MTEVDKTYQQAIHTIFIADDDEEDREILSDAFNHINPSLQIQTFENSDALFSFLNYIKPDLLFLDLDMPCRNGLECIKEIKGNEKTRDIPVVVFSSTSRASNIEVAYEFGANLFLIKPPSYPTLIDSLKRLLALDWTNPDEVRKSRFVNNKYLPFL